MRFILMLTFSTAAMFAADPTTKAAPPVLPTLPEAIRSKVALAQRDYYGSIDALKSAQAAAQKAVEAVKDAHAEAEKVCTAGGALFDQQAVQCVAKPEEAKKEKP